MTINLPSLPAWGSNTEHLQNEYAEHFSLLEGDTEGRVAAQGYLNNSTAVYHDEVIGMGYLPKLYDEAAITHFSEIVKQTYTLLQKITLQFIEDAEYRALFKFSPLLEKMILLPNTYDCTIPISRIDLFLDETNGDFKFCEFNTDGTSAMNEDREVCDALATTDILKSFATHHTVMAQELFDPWIETFIRILDSSSLSVPDPVIAIVDYTESAVLAEQKEFQKRFALQGITCLVVDVATLKYVDGALYGRDISELHPAHSIPFRIDAVYRRAVTLELLRELETDQALATEILSSAVATSGASASSAAASSQSDRPLRGAFALLAAVAQQKICMIGSFATQVAHSKTSFCLLHHPKTQIFLTEEERAFVQDHVPYTSWLNTNCVDIEAVKKEPHAWIIKPADGYGSKGVYAGKNFEDAEWARLVDEKLLDDYIIQEYCPQFQALNTLPVPNNTEGKPLFNNAAEATFLADQGGYDAKELQPYNILTGLYCYSGNLGGIYVRGGQDAIIVGFRGGITLGSLLVDFVPSSKLTLLSRPIMK